MAIPAVRARRNHFGAGERVTTKPRQWDANRARLETSPTGKLDRERRSFGEQQIKSTRLLRGIDYTVRNATREQTKQQSEHERLHVEVHRPELRERMKSTVDDARARRVRFRCVFVVIVTIGGSVRGGGGGGGGSSAPSVPPLPSVLLARSRRVNKLDNNTHAHNIIYYMRDVLFFFFRQFTENYVVKRQVRLFAKTRIRV